MKSYLLVDPVQRVRSRFSPLAAKIGQGASQFNDHTAHEYWEIIHWGKGIGYNADSGVEGGYLYGEVDTRAGDEFVLPPLLTVRTAESNSDTSPSVNNITDGSPYVVNPPNKIAIKFYMDVAGDIFVFMDARGSVSAAIQGDSGGVPDGTNQWTGTASSTPNSVIAEWTRISNDFTPTPSTVYWLVLWDDNGDLVMHAQTLSATGGEMLVHDGVSWGNPSTQTVYSPYMAGAGQLGTIVAAQTVGSDLYTLADDGEIFKWNGATGTFDSFADTAETSTDMQLWYGELVVCHDDTAYMDRVNTTTASITALTDYGTMLTVWNGYLWKSQDNIVSYSSQDLSSWTDITCGPDDYAVRGMAGLGDDVIVSTDQAVWRIAPGDWVFSITKWAYQSANNGKGMNNNQGAVFIPADNTLIRMQSNAPLINIWKREESLPGNRAGIIDGVIGTNKEVIIYINPADAGGIATVWSFNKNGWHHVARIPTSQEITLMHYDDSNDSIWIFTDSGHAYSFYASTTSSSPTTDSLSEFHPAGWVDMGVYHGGLQTVIKDFDSVRVVGENISPVKPVTIFWRDPESFDTEYIYDTSGTIMTDTASILMQETKSGWSELGQIIESGDQLRWTDHATRPVGVGINLAYSIVTEDVSTSPEIRAVVVKYHSHIIDQFRWQLPVMVSNYQEMIDGTRDPRSAAELMAEIEAMDVDRYLPIFYEDVDGRQYEVKVIGFAERLMKYEKTKTASAPDLHHVIDLTIQEMAPYA